MNKPVNTAAFLTAEKAYPLEFGEAPYPTPINDEVIVKTAAIAINPVDWIVQSTAFIPLPYPWILGRDVAGPVVAVGPAQTALRVGDRVAGLAPGFATKDPSASAFQAFVRLSPPLVVGPLPPRLPFVDAAVLPLGVATAAAGLFGDGLLGLRLPPATSTDAEVAAGSKDEDEEEEEEGRDTLLVWGAASSVGSCAVQLAVAAGYAVLATASPANFAHARALGAADVFDYRRGEDVVERIVEAIEGRNGRFAGVFDAIGTGGAVEACVEVAAKVAASKSEPGTTTTRVSTVRPLPEGLAADGGLPEGVACGVVMATAIRNTHVGPAVFERFLPRALADGRFRCAPAPEVVGEGLGCLQAGLDRLREGRVLARKLVVVLKEGEGEEAKD